MTGRRPGLFWRVTWKVVSPLLLLSIFVAYVAVLAWTPLSYRAWDTQYVGPPGGAGSHLGPAWPFPGATQNPDDILSDLVGRQTFRAPGGIKANHGRDLGQGLSGRRT